MEVSSGMYVAYETDKTGLCTSFIGFHSHEHYINDWLCRETTQIPPNTSEYTLEGLSCGTRYQLYATSFNSIGTGEASDILNTRTKGAKPGVPPAQKFIEVSQNSVTLHLSAWDDGGCPMLYFVVEYKAR